MPEAWILRLMNFVGCAEYRFLHALRSTLASSRLTFWRRTPDDEDQDGSQTPVRLRFSSLFPFPPFSFLYHAVCTARKQPAFSPSRHQTSWNLFLLSFRATRSRSAHRFASLDVLTKCGTKHAAGFCFSSAMDMPASNSLKFADLFTRTSTHLYGNEAPTRLRCYLTAIEIHARTWSHWDYIRRDCTSLMSSFLLSVFQIYLGIHRSLVSDSSDENNFVS